MTDYSAHGSLDLKQVSLNEVCVYHADDDNYKVGIKADSAPAASFDLTLPNQAGQLLCDADSIALSQTDIDGATEESSPSSSMFLPIYDGAANKKVSIQNLFNENGQSGLPSSSNSQILISDGTDYNSRTVGGDLTCDNAGDFTISASSVDNGKIADDAVSTDKIQDDSITDAKIEHAPATDGTAEASKYVKTDASNEIASLNKVSSVDFACSGVVELSSKWRFAINGEKLELQYSSDSGSTYAVAHSFSN